jgi:hypothetical protein
MGGPRRRLYGWYAAAWATIALSVLKGIRLPNLYATTQFYFNYSEGFVRRALVGEIVHLIDAPFMYRYWFVCVISFALLALNVWLLWRVVQDLLKRDDPALSCFALCFTTSLALVFLSHTVGYFDHLGLAMALITIRLRSVRAKLIFLLLGGSATILSHEGTLVLFLPVAYLSVLLASGDRGWNRTRALLLGIVIFHTALTFGMGTFALLSATAPARLFADMSRKADIPLDEGTFTYLLSKKAAVIQGSEMRSALVANIDSITIVLPALATFIAFTLCALGRAPWYLVVAAVMASVSPIAMHLLGVDMHRWDTIALTTSFLSAYLSYDWLRRTGGDAAAAWWGGGGLQYLPLLVAVIAINASSMTFLFDGEHVKQFPFFEHRKHLVELLRALRHPHP